jgi:hypothetical protein
MTETQATSGAAGTSTAGSASDTASDGVGASNDGFDTASGNGRVAVGRASVPAEPTGKLATDASLDYSTGTSTAGSGFAPASGSRTDFGGDPTASAGYSLTAPSIGTPPKPSGLGAAATTTAPPPAAPAKPAGPVKSAGPVKTPGRTTVDTTATRPGASTTRPTGAGRAGAPGSRGPRRARLVVRRLDPWSVMKFSFAVSLVMFVVLIVATAVLYLALDQMGVFESVNKMLNDTVNSKDSSGGLRVTAIGVIGTSALLGAVGIVLITALGTLGSFVYNVCADLVGGIEVTLAEKD